MADIFLSYAREDLDRVIPIAHELEKLGWSVFWDKKIPPGKRWRIYLKEKLDESRCVLVVWSPDSIKSNWVHAEAEEALNRDILIPLLLDAVKPPFGLGDIQAADLSNWKNKSNDPEFQQLIDAITDIIPLSQKSSSQPVSQSIASTVTPASTTLKIGDEYGGGKVAWLDSTGKHGLIAAKADLPGGDKYTWDEAKKTCKELKENGYSDWRLPSKDELNHLYTNRSAVGGFAGVSYWSSTEDSAVNAWFQFFGSGDQIYYCIKYSEWRVRPVRAF